MRGAAGGARSQGQEELGKGGSTTELGAWAGQTAAVTPPPCTFTPAHTCSHLRLTSHVHTVLRRP